MGRRDSKPKGSAKTSERYPKASAIKSVPNDGTDRVRLAFEDHMASFDAAAALKLRPEPEEENDPTEVSSRDPKLASQSYGHPRGTPTLSPSGVNRLKNNKNASPTQAQPELEPQTRVTRVQVTKVLPGVARRTQDPSKEQSQSQSHAHAQSRIQSPPQSEDKDESESKILFLAIAAIAALAILYFVMQPSGSVVVPKKSRYTSEEQKQMVKWHRFETGADLNRGRVDAEYNNYRTAPVLPSSASKQPGPNMMDGIPLVQENDLRTTARDRLEPANPNDPDHRVEYILQDEQAAEDWTDRAQHEYVREFVKNAHDAGLKVRVRNNMDVEVQRLPQSVDSTGQSGQRGGSQGAR